MTKPQESKLNLEQELKELVAEVLETEPQKIDPSAKFVDDLGMDSMMALEILAALEKKFRITIPEETMPKFTTLNATAAIIQELLAKNKK